MIPVITRELLRRLPKAELHCHLDGSVRPATLIELGHEYGKPMPARDPEELYAYMVVRGARNLEDYLARFAVTLSVMQHAEALERIAYELLEDSACDGVRYLEMRFSPVLNLAGGMSLGEAVEAPLRAIERARGKLDIIGRVIVCGLRNLSPEISMELARLAVAYRHRGVVGFDLAGGERDNPARAHADAFRYARENSLAVTVHAGEGDGAESVRQAVHDCCADRLGHATRLVEDEALLQYVNDRRIALEICLTSNVQTRVAADYETHPLRRYFDRGLNVVLNTDNRLMSGTVLSEEYWHAATQLGFTLPELVAVARSGFASAFLPWEERQALMKAMDAETRSLVTPR